MTKRANGGAEIQGSARPESAKTTASAAGTIVHGSTTRLGASTAAGGCFSSPPTLAVSASGWRHVSERCDNLHLPVNSNAPNKNPCHRLGGETDFPRVISNQVIFATTIDSVGYPNAAVPGNVAASMARPVAFAMSCSLCVRL